MLEGAGGVRTVDSQYFTNLRRIEQQINHQQWKLQHQLVMKLNEAENPCFELVEAKRRTFSMRFRDRQRSRKAYNEYTNG